MTTPYKATLCAAACALAATPLMAADAITTKMDRDAKGHTYNIALGPNGVYQGITAAGNVISAKMNSDAKTHTYNVAMGSNGVYQGITAAGNVISAKMNSDAKTHTYNIAMGPNGVYQGAGSIVTAKVETDALHPMASFAGASTSTYQSVSTYQGITAADNVISVKMDRDAKSHLYSIVVEGADPYAAMTSKMNDDYATITTDPNRCEPGNACF